MKTKKNISIILPTYNEGACILGVITEIKKYIPSNLKYEIIVVDDNSPDKTFNKVRDYFKRDNNIITYLRKSNRGFAKSILKGIQLSKGEKIIVMDSDGTHDPSEIPLLIYLSKKFDIVSASRFCSGGEMENKGHYIASFIYNLFLRVILKTQIQDNLGGFFIINKSLIDKLPLSLIFKGYGEYYFRLLYSTRLLNYKILEIPSFYRKRIAGSSKSSWIKMILMYSISAFKFKRSIKKKNLK